MTDKPLNIPTLTPLRGIAALMVAVFHFDGVVANFVNQQQSMLIAKCYLMVDLFFIMSGFIILHVYGDKFSVSINKAGFLKFIGARFARIYPLHFFTLLIWVALFYALNQPPSPINNPMAIPTHLLLLHSFGIHNIFTWNVPSWSISAEWWAYIIFPMLAIFIARFKNIAIITLSIFSMMAYIAIMYFLPRVNIFVPDLPVPHNLDVTYNYGYLRGIAGFIAGMICYLAFEQQKINNYLRRDLISFLIIIITIILFHFGVNDLLLIPCFMLLVISIAANQGVIYKIFQFKPLQYLGDISYSIYLVHVLLMFYFAVPIIERFGYVYKGPGSLKMPFITGFGFCIVYIVAVILLSTISFYTIEKPCRDWLNKKFKKAKSISQENLQPSLS